MNILYLIKDFLILPFAFLFLISGYYSGQKGGMVSLGYIFFIINLCIIIIFALITGTFEKAIVNIILLGYFTYFALLYTEQLSKPVLDALDYFTRIIIWFSIIWYFIMHIPVVRGIMIYLIAVPSMILSWMAKTGFRLYGIDYGEMNLFWETKPYFLTKTNWELNVPVMYANIAVVLECTGLREILIALFAVRFTRAHRDIKKKVTAVNIIIILLVNIFRNNIVIYFAGTEKLSFEYIHGVVGNIIVFIAVVVVLVQTFIRIPEVYQKVWLGLRFFKESSSHQRSDS